jgi:hypothetical protein
VAKKKPPKKKSWPKAHGYVCPHCDEALSTPKEFEAHLYEVHKQPPSFPEGATFSMESDTDEGSARK